MLGHIFHVGMISETWLSSEIDDSMVHIPGFKLFRLDRKKLNEKGNDKRGGGVAIYVKCGLGVKIIDQSSEKDDIEFLLLELKTNHVSTLLGTVYFPYSTAVKLTPLKSSLTNLVSYFENIIIGGDFNIDLLDQNDYLQKIFLSSMKSIALDVVNKTCHTRVDPVTARASLLDLFLIPTEKFSCLHTFGQISLPGSSDHDLIYMSFNTSFNITPSKFTYRDYKNCNLNLLMRDSLTIPWSNLFHLNSVDEKVNFLNQMILDIFNKHVPLRTCNKKLDYISYYSEDITQLANDRDAAYQIWKSTKS